MRRKVAGRVHHQRECALCHGGIAEQRPVFLIAMADGKILGPYHAGCAAKLSPLVSGRKVPAVDIEGDLYGQLPLPREETLPW